MADCSDVEHGRDDGLSSERLPSADYRRNEMRIYIEMFPEHYIGDDISVTLHVRQGGLHHRDASILRDEILKAYWKLEREGLITKEVWDENSKKFDRD